MHVATGSKAVRKKRRAPKASLTHQVFKFEPGDCVCILGDPNAGATSVDVRRASGTEAVLNPTELLRENQYVYATLKLKDGPSFALAGLVVTTAAGGILIQWKHDKPQDGDKVDAALELHFRAKEEKAAREEKEEKARVA